MARSTEAPENTLTIQNYKAVGKMIYLTIGPAVQYRELYLVFCDKPICEKTEKE